MALKKKAAAKKKATESSEKEGKGTPTAFVQDYQVIISPLITEKSAAVASDRTRAVFRVDPRAGKDEIRAAVERIWGVKVASVRTANYQGKMKRTTRSVGRRAGYKKAYVTLKEGQTLNIVEGV